MLTGWEAGAMFGTLIDYWYMTGDSTYNDLTLQAIVHQFAPKGDFMPKNQTLAMGNDDQGFWAMTAMMAAENVFPNPPSDKPQYLSAVQAVFNEFVTRWQDEGDICDGGLRWQVYSWRDEYYYKNTIANGCFFNIASRLARFTGNSSYGDWADKIWDWEVGQGLITDDYLVYDGIDNIKGTKICETLHVVQWSYNLGIFMHGAATMYNITQDDKWKDRVNGLLNHTQEIFVNGSVVYEQFCEPHGTCNIDQETFKGYLLRSMAATSHLAPWTYDTISKLFADSGEAAAAACSGPVSDKFAGVEGTACGFTWEPKGTFDGLVGVGPQMNALCAVMYNLVQNVQPPATDDDRGTSKGDPNGGQSDSDALPNSFKPITAADRAGAGIVTVLLAGAVVACSVWISTGK